MAKKDGERCASQQCRAADSTRLSVHNQTDFALHVRSICTPFVDLQPGWADDSSALRCARKQRSTALPTSQPKFSRLLVQVYYHRLHSKWPFCRSAIFRGPCSLLCDLPFALLSSLWFFFFFALFLSDAMRCNDLHSKRMRAAPFIGGEMKRSGLRWLAASLHREQSTRLKHKDLTV